MEHFHHFGRHGFGRGRFGEGPLGQHGRGMRGGGRGRGEMKFEILGVLVDGPRHGYDIMLEIETRSGMRPSPGSIYPSLQMLEDGDFIVGSEQNGKRTFTITDKGRELLAQRSGEPGDSEQREHLREFYGTIHEAMRHVHGIKEAAKQILHSGNLETSKSALAVLDRARRELFQILADNV